MTNSIPIESDDASRKKWLSFERYFARSWTHIFYRWKYQRIMLGETVHSLLAHPGSKAPVVLELGCGLGHGIFEAQSSCNGIGEMRWYGLDRDGLAIATASVFSRFREAERRLPPVRFLTADLNALPFGDATVDVALCAEVLEHMADPSAAIAEMARILKPGGYAVITTPNPQNPVECIGAAIDKFLGGALKKKFWSGQDAVTAPPLEAAVGLGHVSVFPYKAWQGWLKDAGLPVVKKVRGPLLFGGPFFDQNRFVSGCLIALDPLMDRLPGCYLLSTNLGMICRRR
jgi:SAM-dependent methyltransferase